LARSRRNYKIIFPQVIYAIIAQNVSEINMKATRATAISLAAVLAASAFAAIATVPAFAQGSEGACWGEATADATPLGEHSSSFGEPRTGLGNLKNSVGDWAALLGLLETLSGEDLSDCA
jgi:hypothetical protein